jgi:lipopolysaccharide/colanic/teichoic acid biosynthesis glycosyltransferase
VGAPMAWRFPQGFDADWVTACLQKSPIKTVRLDLQLSAELLEAWSIAAQKADKTIYVSLPVMAQLPQKTQPIGWLLKRGIDYLVTVLLMGMLLPVIFGLILVLQPPSWKMLFVREWHVGERGKLFQTFRLRTRDSQGNWLRGGRLIYQWKLDRLPKFFNVLRGELSLVGSCPWKIEDAAQADMALRHRLNGLPGVTGLWMLQARWKILDSYFLSQIDLDYLWNWSLVGDLRFLMVMMSRIMDVSRLINV